MPNYIFNRYIDNLEITINAVNYLANEFNMSRTSAAIRFIEKSSQPCMIACWDKNGARRWFRRNSIVPDYIWPHEKIIQPKTALNLSNGMEVDADKWISTDGAEKFTLIESVFIMVMIFYHYYGGKMSLNWLIRIHDEVKLFFCHYLKSSHQQLKEF
jgi:hypothetical protein